MTMCVIDMLGDGWCERTGKRPDGCFQRMMVKRTRMVMIIRVTACRLGATMFSCGVDQWLPPNVNRFGCLLGDIICNPPDSFVKLVVPLSRQVIQSPIWRLVVVSLDPHQPPVTYDQWNLECTYVLEIRIRSFQELFFYYAVISTYYFDIYYLKYSEYPWFLSYLSWS